MPNQTPTTTVDPLLAPPQSMPASPLLTDELPPLRPSLLDYSPSSRRMENLDALRILSMFVIIITHVTEPYLDHNANYDGLYKSVFSLNVASRFGVPCFLMISFFIYWHQLYVKGRTWGELLARRFKRLIPAFVCWSIFYFALHKFLASRNLNIYPGPLGERLNWKDAHTWFNVLLLGRAEGHLYYLPMVMTCLLLIPVLKALWKPPVISWTYISVTLFAWAGVYYGSAFLPDHSAARGLVERTVTLWQNVVAIPLLVFPLVGMMSAGQIEWRRFIAKTPTSAWITLLIGGIALHVLETLLVFDREWLQALNGLKIGRFVTAVAVFVLFLRRPLMKDPFPKVSHYAFGLHFMHPAVILLLGIAEMKLLGASANDWSRFIVPLLVLNLVLTFSITFGLCLLVGRVKKLEFLVV